MPRHAWGIDIGDGTLKAVRLKAEGRALHVAEVVEIPYLDPFLKKRSPPATIDRRAIAALLQFGSSVRITDTDRVAVAFPSFQTLEGVIEVPRVETAQRDRMIEFEVSDMVDIPLRDLSIRHRHHRFRSEDIEQVMIHAVRQRELAAFFHYLDESGIPYDRIVSPGAALADMARICVTLNKKYLVISPGFNATDLVALSGTDFWTRTLPLGLPVAPGEAMEVAREKIAELCQVLELEIRAFLNRILPGKDFTPQKALVSGEGARVPAFINALDAVLPVPVEVMRPATRLAPIQERAGMPPENVVHSMGKAIGLALGACDDTRTACSLAEIQVRRRALRKLPLLSGLAAVVLLMVLGMAWLEKNRSGRLEQAEAAMARLAPSDRAAAMEDLMARAEANNAALVVLEAAHRSRARLLVLGKILSRMEEESVRGTFGDYHLADLVLDFNEPETINSFVGTRMADEELARFELKSAFQAFASALKIEGPLPSGEETPPEGLAPLVLYRVEGLLHGK
jgi:Tfp pilus assembly PilM family ATPase